MSVSNHSLTFAGKVSEESIHPSPSSSVSALFSRPSPSRSPSGLRVIAEVAAEASIVCALLNASVCTTVTV